MMVNAGKYASPRISYVIKQFGAPLSNPNKQRFPFTRWWFQASFIFTPT